MCVACPVQSFSPLRMVWSIRMIYNIVFKQLNENPFCMPRTLKKTLGFQMYNKSDLTTETEKYIIKY